MNFIEEYKELLILQYSNKPKALSEILSLAKNYKVIFDAIKSIEASFDLDSAVGEQLDIIGRIIGLNRLVPLVVPKKYFGFNNINSSTVGFGSAPFKNSSEESHGDYSLSDDDYRFLIKAKISKNNFKNNTVSINEIVGYLFNDLAFVVDNKDMTLTLFVDKNIDMRLVNIALALDLLPRPQGVGYNDTKIYSKAPYFGFNNINPNSVGFGDGNFKDDFYF